IQLADKQVYERSYRSVFHFIYASKETTGDQCHDFREDDDPFLAFAARCTSSLPVAFEAMRLDDIRAMEPHLDLEACVVGKPVPNGGVAQEGWGRFARDYTRQ